jgi:hypothetical protein
VVQLGLGRACRRICHTTEDKIILKLADGLRHQSDLQGRAQFSCVTPCNRRLDQSSSFGVREVSRAFRSAVDHDRVIAPLAFAHVSSTVGALFNRLGVSFSAMVEVVATHVHEAEKIAFWRDSSMVDRP